MTELVTVDKPKQQERILPPLKLETLGKGLGNINAGYPLHEVIAFIKGLDVNTSIRTNQSERDLGIIFPTPTLFRVNKLKEFDSIIYITGPLKRREPETRGKEERQIWRPTEFVAGIAFNKDLEDNLGLLFVDKIKLFTRLSERDAKSIIKAALGKVPRKWQFNPR
ncbi:MAG: hypothetical protein Q7R31_00475 [Candidatus Levybacteria bacterium]|nr:hypothetical protein [Candidatus Levybacteria bacterium]